MRNTAILTPVLLLSLGFAVSACTGNIDNKEDQFVGPMPIEEKKETTKTEDIAQLEKAKMEETLPKDSTLKVVDESAELVVEKKPIEEDKPPVQEIVYFGVNKSKTPEQYHELLLSHVNYIKNHPEMMINVNGHADVTGNALYNKKLSEKRAKSVTKFFIDNGVPQGQIQITSFGDNLPLTDTENMEQNRRVELHYSQIYTLKQTP